MGNMEQREQAENVVQALGRFCNRYGVDELEFCQLMARQHPTLQQGFTRLVLHWIDYMASEDYWVDGRNEYSKEVAVLITKLVAEHKGYRFGIVADAPMV